MPRVNLQEIEQQIVDRITAAGGDVSHADLVAQLEPAAQQHLPRIAKTGAIVASVRAVPDGKPVVYYQLPQ